MASSNGLRVKVRIDGIREVLAQLDQIPPEATQLLRSKTREISNKLAANVKAAAVLDSRQSALMAPTVKAGADVQPGVSAGGGKRVGRNRVPANKILFGSEFGATRYRQFRPHRGAASYWFFRTVERHQDEIDRDWQSMADEIVQRWHA